jgi:type IV secretory pathway VirB4 component
MIPISLFTRKTRAFSDFLRYALPMGNGVVRLKGNGFLRSFAFRGPDLATSSWDELIARSERLGGLLRKLDDQWGVHVDSFRVAARDYPEEGHWPDRLTFLLDQDRRVRYKAEGEHFETRHVVTFSFYPRRQRANKVGQWLQNSPKLEAGSDEAAEDLFLGLTDEIAAAARGVFLTFAPLGSIETVNSLGRPIVFDETLSFLSLCVRGRAHPIALIEDAPMYLDGIIGADDVRVGWDIRAGNKHVAVLVIEGYPGYSYPGILDALAEQPCEYRWSQRFIPMSRRQADARLGWLSKGWGLVALGGLGFLTGGAAGKRDNVALKYKAQAVEAQERAREGLMYGHYLSTIVIHAPDERTRDQVSERVKSAIEQVEGFAVRIEDENAMEAFIASLPGERDASEYREARVSVRNAAHFFPLTATWAGPVEHTNKRFGKGAPPLLWTTTNGATPFRLSLHVGELGHALVVGKSGGGKSALLMRLVSAHLARYARARAWMFDVGFSAYKYCLGAGGFHYVIGEENGPSLAPLTGLNDPTRRRSILKWLRGDVFELRERLSDEQSKELADALRDLGSIRSDARLSDLSVAVQDSSLRRVLDEYAGSFLDGRTDDLDFRAIEARGHVPFYCFEYGPLGVDNTLMTTPFVQYVRRRIREAIREDADEPGMVLFDEGHRALKIGNLQEFGEEVLREGRKSLLQFVFATQEPTDVVDSEIGPVLRNLTAVKIFLPNADAMTEDNLKAYKWLGLKTEEVRLLTQMEPFTYLYKSEYGTRVFTLEMSEFELAFLAGASPTDKGLVDRVISESGFTGWPARYMRVTDPGLEPYARAYEDSIRPARFAS